MADSHDENDVARWVVLVEREVPGAPLKNDQLAQPFKGGASHFWGVFEHTEAPKNSANDLTNVQIGGCDKAANSVEVLVRLDRQLNQRQRTFFSRGADLPATFAKRCFSTLLRSYA